MANQFKSWEDVEKCHQYLLRHSAEYRNNEATKKLELLRSKANEIIKGAK